MNYKPMSRVLLLALFCTGSLSAAVAQIDIPYTVMQRFEQLGAEMIYPIEADYRYRLAHKNDYLTYDFAIHSRRERMEIRYALLPAAELGELAGYPHVAASRLLMHLAANDEDAVVTTHTLPADEVRYDYQADWVRMFHFRPKKGFSEANHCRLLAIYREGYGMAYVLLLFDTAPEQIDSRSLALRFRAPLPRQEE